MADYEVLEPGGHARLVSDMKDYVAKVTFCSLEYDDGLGRYTDESVASLVAHHRDGLAYGVSIPKGSVTSCVKTGANAGLAVPVPGIVGSPAVDPYVGRGPFWFMECNGYVDADGTPHVTAVRGDGAFARDGSNGNVWILAPTL